METKEEKTNSNERITLESKEGVPYYLKRSAVEKSPVLKMILKRGIEEKTKTINLQEIDTGTVKALQLLLEIGSKQGNLILQQMVENKTIEELHNLSKAADFLDLKEFKTKACSPVLEHQLRQKSFPEIDYRKLSYTVVNPCVVIDGDRVVICGQDKNNVHVLIILNKYSGKEILRLEVDKTLRFSCIAVDSKHIIGGFQNGMLKMWNKNTLEELQTIETNNGYIREVSCVAMDNNHIISGSFHGILNIWDKDTGKELRTLKEHWARINCIAVDKDIIVSGSFDFTINVWDKKTDKILYTLKRNNYLGINNVIIDGDHLISSDCASIKIYDKHTGKELHTLKIKPFSTIQSLAVDDKYIIAGCNYGLYIFDKHTYKERIIFNRANQCVVSDGVHIISGTSDGTVKRLNLTNVYTFEQFLCALPLVYAKLLSQFSTTLMSNNNNAKTTLTADEKEIYIQFLDTIKEHWGTTVQEAIRQTLDQYRQGC